MADTYTTGTISVTAASSPIVGVGTAWASIIYRGDVLVHNLSGVSCLIDTVTDNTHIIPFGAHWPGATISGAAYTIYKSSPLRLAGTSAMQVVIDAWELLQQTGVIYAVVGVGVSPDVGVGTDGQYAINLDDAPWVFWKKVAGAWVAQGNLITDSASVESSVAAAATTNIGTASGKFIVITGTTGPCTSLGTSANKERIVRHNGETWTCNTTSLILLGLANGANRVNPVGAISYMQSNASGNWRELLYQQPTGQKAIDNSSPQAGILAVDSTTQISFKPKNGDKIQVGGLVYPIPSAGVLGANTSVFVNATGGQNLAANTNYLVGVFVNAGVLTFDFFSTLTHVPDTTAGNVGVEIISGTSPSRTVVGMIRTNASSQFVDSTASRFCLSWFNRQLKIAVFAPGNQSTASTSNVALGSTIPALNWSDEPLQAILLGQWGTSAAGGFAQVAVGIDGTTIYSDSTFTYGTTGSNGTSVTVGGWGNPTQGSHTYGAIGGASSGSGTAALNNSSLRIATRG